MTNTRFFSILLALACIPICASAAFAGDWNNPSGSNSEFAWTLGENYITNPGTHGSPVVDAAGFHFSSEYAVDPMLIEIDDQQTASQAGVRVRIDSVAGIDTITVREGGSFVSADPLNDFQLQASLSMLNWAPIMSINTAGELMFPTGDISFVQETATEGTWSWEYTLVIGDPANNWYFANPMANNPAFPWDQFTLTIKNEPNLTAAGITAQASWQKNYVDIIVPEPGTAALLLMGLSPVVALRRRR